jgi:tRNA(Ile)-lysidine synthetase, C-terminal domain
MHFLRGAGLSGLKGMPYRIFLDEWSSSIPLVRPLLDVWRDEILDYCGTHDLLPITDASNFDTNYYRNRLRYELIPYLENYNPQIKQVIWRMAQTLAGDQEVLDSLVQETWAKCWLQTGDGFVVLSLDSLRQVSKALQRHVLRQAIGTLRPFLRDIDYEAIERAIAFVNNPARTGQADLISGLRISVEQDKLYLAENSTRILDPDWPQLTAAGTLTMTCPGEVHIGKDWLLTCEILTDMRLEEINLLFDDPMQAWLDAQTLSFPLVVRTRQPGDRFQPLGMDGHSLKLSDFWVNEKLSSRARLGWPLVCSAENIVWLPGFRPSHASRVQPNTQQVVHLHLVRTR